MIESLKTIALSSILFASYCGMVYAQDAPLTVKKTPIIGTSCFSSSQLGSAIGTLGEQVVEDGIVKFPEIIGEGKIEERSYQYVLTRHPKTREFTFVYFPSETVACILVIGQVHNSGE